MKSSQSRGSRQKRRALWTMKAALAVELEMLDPRSLLSATAAVVPTIHAEHPLASSAPSGYTPTQLQVAYGFSRLSLSSGADGTGQTIAIVDAYNAPTIKADLQAFDRAFGLQDPPSFTVMSQTGSTTSLPPSDPSTDRSNDWEVEEALDVEWAHALAPGAKIILVEANSPNDSDLMTAVRTAANLPGVSVVSMSWGGDEDPTETSDDSGFLTPSGHAGVTFIASTGDNGQPGGFPAYSPNVLAVGGTTLNLAASGTYQSESGWSDSGGGISNYETQPTYQHGFVTQSSTRRTIPDVSFDADPNTGVSVYDSFSFGTSRPWGQIGGTSLSAPAWGSVIATVDQQRALNGLGSLDGKTQTMPMLYQLDQTNPSAFHDITSGNNGFAARAGYDLVTGIGSPVVNVLVPAMGGSTSSTSHLAFVQMPSTGTAGQSVSPVVKVAIENQNGQIVTSNSSTVVLTIGSGPGGFASGNSVSATAVNGVATFTNITLNVAGKYTLTATDTGMTNVTSNSLTINPGVATKLAFQQVPATAALNQALSPSVIVAVEDSFGNVVTANVSTVSVAVATGPGKLTAGSTSSVAAVNGLATFSNLVFGTAGAYTLSATDGSLTKTTSTSFTIGQTLAAPVLKVAALSSTSVQLAWGAVAGAQGYRVYRFVGATPVLIASTTSTSFVATGLTAGATVSFKVQAYKGTLTADSAPVSLRMPQISPVLSIQGLSSTSVQLSWTAVAGAQGYNVYWTDGFERYYLGSVGGSSTSVRITGLSRWSTYGFQVEAYQGNKVEDSNWVWTGPSSSFSRTVSSAMDEIYHDVSPVSGRPSHRG